jgi:hypothetical protein
MVDSKAFTATELEGHQIGLTCPGPEYVTVLTDLASGLQISNVVRYTLQDELTGARSITITLDSGATAMADVHHIFTTAEVPGTDPTGATDPVMPAVTPAPIVTPVEEV